jgi:hypothetical protein
VIEMGAMERMCDSEPLEHYPFPSDMFDICKFFNWLIYPISVQPVSYNLGIALILVFYSVSLTHLLS